MAGVEPRGDSGGAEGGRSEREDRCAGGAARAGAPEVAPSTRDNLRSGGGVKPNLATQFPPGAASAGPGPASALLASVGAAASLPRQRKRGKGGADEAYRSLTLGTASLLMENGEGKVKESCFNFFPP